MSGEVDTKLSGLAAQILRDAVGTFEGDGVGPNGLADGSTSMFADRLDITGSFSTLTGSFLATTGSFQATTGPIATLANEPDKGVGLKELFGLGAKLSPVRLLSAAELAAHARSAPLMGKLEAFAAWLGRGRPLDPENHLLEADAVAAAHWVGVSRGYLPYLWEYAVTAGWFELEDRPRGKRKWAVLGDTAQRWAVGDDSAALRVWAVVFAAVLSQTLEVAASRDPGAARKLNFEGRGVVVAMMLFLARRAGLSPADVEDLVMGGTVGKRPSSRARRAWAGWVRKHGDPARLLVSELSALDAVAVPQPRDGVVGLTPLAVWALREQVMRDGVRVPVLSMSMADISAPVLVSMADGVEETEFAADFAAWLASRGPERGAEELLEYAGFGRARSRLVAVSLVHRIGVPAYGAWRNSMRRPELCGYARIALSVMAADLPRSALPADIEPGQDDLDRVAGDLLEAGFGEAAPDSRQIAARLRQAVPEGAEIWIIGLMSRCPHPQVIQVLTVLGKRHPDWELAKTARKAARRARRVRRARR
jgi:hypothetical protein